MGMLNRNDVWWGADFAHVDILNVYYSSTLFAWIQLECAYVGLVEAYSTILLMVQAKSAPIYQNSEL